MVFDFGLMEKKKYVVSWISLIDQMLCERWVGSEAESSFSRKMTGKNVVIFIILVCKWIRCTLSSRMNHTELIIFYISGWVDTINSEISNMCDFFPWITWNLFWIRYFDLPYTVYVVVVKVFFWNVSWISSVSYQSWWLTWYWHLVIPFHLLISFPVLSPNFHGI